MFFDLWLWILVFIFVVSVMGIWFILSFDCELLFCIYNLINAIIVVTVMGNWCFLSFDCEFRFFCTDFGSFWLFECVRVSVELFFFFYIWGVWFGSRIKGMPHIISMTQMQKWWFGRGNLYGTTWRVCDSWTRR